MPAQRAAEEFLEQTPWANPSHPAHANAVMPRFHAQTTIGSSPLASPRGREPTAAKGKGPAYLAPSAPSARQIVGTTLANDAPTVPAAARVRRGARDTERIQTTHASSLAPPPTAVKEPPREAVSGSSSTRPRVNNETEQTALAGGQGASGAQAARFGPHGVHQPVAGRIGAVDGAPAAVRMAPTMRDIPTIHNTATMRDAPAMHAPVGTGRQIKIEIVPVGSSGT
jgi:hypothetical protein